MAGNPRWVTAPTGRSRTRLALSVSAETLRLVAQSVDGAPSCGFRAFLIRTTVSSPIAPATII